MQEEEIIYEASDIIEEVSPEVVEVDIFEAFQAPTAGDEFNHALLTNREIHDAHPITAITGLREELDSIEALQTIYSDKKGNADYYEWADGHALGENGVGYFVSLNEDARTISICAGDDIFGVVVDNAAFVGGQDDITRDEHYGLVVTSGAVHVRCELDVAEGDYVVSNAYGMATTASSGRGYKVVALHDIKGVPHATINLNISADQIDLMGAELQDLDSRMDAAETNIVSAVNVANEAHKRSLEAATSSSISEEVVRDALESILNSEQKIEEFEQIIGSTSITAAQARAIAESAVTSAISIKDEAVAEANKALKETSDLRDEFKSMEEGITEIDDRVTIVTNRVAGNYTIVASWDKTGKDADVVYYAEDTKLYWYYDNNVWKSTTDAYTAGLPMAVSGIQVKVDNHSSSINSLASWQGNTNISMARIEQKADANGAYIQSTVSNMDKYSVGPHSQAYGFTLEQAASVLEEGMIYVPTENVTEIYEYTDADGATQTYERSFVSGFLYKWGELTDYPYGWITVDKDYVETDETNISSKAVYFTPTEPTVSGNFGYWYTDGDTITGTTGTYEPYTLYKWDLPYKYKDKTDDGAIVDVEEYRWVAVATLAGNSQSRAVSQIRQDANSIEAEVTNARGDAASLGLRITETEADIQSLASWTKDAAGNQYNLATIKQTADTAGASITQVVEAVGEDGEVSAASIVAAVVEDESAITLLADQILLEAPEIDLTGYVTVASLQEDGTTEIDGARIKTGSIESNEYDFNSSTQYANKGTSFDLDSGQIISQHFRISGDGKAYFKEGKIGGWNVGSSTLTSDNVGLSSTPASNNNPIRIYAGGTTQADAKFKVYNNGSMSSTLGDIGGWIIDEDAIYSDAQNSDTVCGICSITSSETTYTGSTNGLIFTLDEATNTYLVKEDPAKKASITDISIPMFYNNRLVTSIEAFAFGVSTGETSNLKSITIPSSITYMGTGAFVGCEKLENITIPGSVTFMDWRSCGWNRSLKTVTICDGVTHIGEEMCQLCDALETVNIPDSVISIGKSAFEGCGSFTINYSGTSTQWQAIVKGAEWCDGSDYVTINYNQTKYFDNSSMGYGYQSLANRGKTSLPRFFAGNKKRNNLNIPIIGSKPNFLVLEDGSLYANAAKIQGNFDIESGKLGNMYVYNNSITNRTIDSTWSDDFLSINNDGYILASELRLHNWLKTAQITSPHDSSKYLKFIYESSGSGIDKFNLQVSHILIDSDLEGLPPKYVKITVQTSPSGQLTLNQPLTVLLRICYVSGDIKQLSTVYTEIKAVQIEAGTASNTISVDYSIGEYNFNNVQLLGDTTFERPGGDADPQLEISLPLVPSANKEIDLGSNQKYWNTFYAKIGYFSDELYLKGSSVGGSDRNIKKDIADLDDKYSIIFDNLRPVQYKFIENTSNRTHTGLIAQEVEEAVIKAGLTSQDFAALCYWDKEDGEKGYGLRYGEFISLNIAETQKLKKRVTELEAKNLELEERLARLEALINTQQND